METKPRAKTMEELEAEVTAEEQAIGKTPAIPAEPAATPEPPPAPPAATPEPPPAPSADVESLRQQLAQRDQEVEALRKRLRDDNGRHGGEMASLRTQVERLTDQLRQVMADRAAKPPETPKPPEPDELEREYPDIAKGVDARTGRALSIAEQAAKQAAEATRVTLEARQERFIGAVTAAVPKWREHNDDQAFAEWCDGREPGSVETRQQVFDRCARDMNPQPIIELYQKWESSKAVQSPESAPTLPTPKGPQKPPLAAQMEVPQAAGGPQKPEQQAQNTMTRARIKELEDKVLRFGTGTAKDREELEALYDAEASGKIK